MTRILIVLTGAALMATTAMAGPDRAHHRDIEAPTQSHGLEREPLNRPISKNPTANDGDTETPAETRRPSRGDRPSTGRTPIDPAPPPADSGGYTEDSLGAFVRARLDEGLRGRALADAIAAEHARRRGVEITDHMRRNASRAAAKATAHHERDSKPTRGRR